MSLINCPECNKEVSNKARICPHCGTKRDANYSEQAEIKDILKKMKDLDPKLDFPFDGKIPQAVGCDQCNGSGYQ